MQRSETASLSPPRRPRGNVPGRGPGSVPGLIPGSVLLALLAAGTASCDISRNIPFLYRIEIQQGNLIEQKVLDRLQPGMSRQEVQQAMGTALLRDPFHGDRWHYVYYLRDDDEERTKRHIVLHFEDNKLVSVEGDVKQGSGNRERAARDDRRAVRIPEDPEREERQEEEDEERPIRHETPGERELGPETGESILRDIEDLEEEEKQP